MEEDIFLKKMKGVKPLNKDTVKSKKYNKNNKNKSDIKNLKKEPKLIKNFQETNQTKPNLNLSFGEINKDLKRGKIKIDRRLDLHGYSLLDAYEKFKKEVVKTYNRNKRCLLVITGKGTYLSPNKYKEIENDQKPKLFYGKIKNSIINWINEDELKNYVLTYQDAGIENGGDGAIFVYLRKKS